MDQLSENFEECGTKQMKIFYFWLKRKFFTKIDYSELSNEDISDLLNHICKWL